MKVVVTGASGFVGRVIVKELLKEGHEVHVLTRNVTKAALVLGSKCRYFQWASLSEKPPVEALKGAHSIIHLLGEGLADKRWDEDKKKKIYDSRIQSTRRLVEALEELKADAPKALVSTSAVGVYGTHGDEVLTESSETGSDFLAKVCVDWEVEANKAEKLGVRVAIIRVGMVIGKNGGALKKMLPVFKLGVGGPLGSGKQWMSWVHVDDLARMYVLAATNSSFKGVYNGVSPTPVTNKNFSYTLGRVLCRPAFAPAPAFAIKMAFGEMSVVLLEGQKVLPERMSAVKFHFRYPTVDIALRDAI